MVGSLVAVVATVVATVETRGLWVAVVAMEQWWWGLLLALCDDVWLCGGDGRLGGAAVWCWWPWLAWWGCSVAMVTMVGMVGQQLLGGGGDDSHGGVADW